MNKQRIEAATKAFRDEWAKPISEDLWGAAITASDAVLFGPEAMELVAKTILEECEPASEWAVSPPELQELYREVARSVVDVLRRR